MPPRSNPHHVSVPARSPYRLRRQPTPKEHLRDYFQVSKTSKQIKKNIESKMINDRNKNDSIHIEETDK